MALFTVAVGVRACVAFSRCLRFGSLFCVTHSPATQIQRFTQLNQSMGRSLFNFNRINQRQIYAMFLIQSTNMQFPPKIHTEKLLHNRLVCRQALRVFVRRTGAKYRDTLYAARFHNSHKNKSPRTYFIG